MTVGANGFGAESREEGPRLLLRSFGSFSRIEDQPGLGALYEVSRSGPGDWRSLPLDAPFSTFSAFDVEAMSPNFSRSLWAGSTTPGEPESKDLYVSESGFGGRSFSPVGPAAPPSVRHQVLNFAGASDDLSRLMFRAFAPVSSNESYLWPGDKTKGEGMPSIYEYADTDNAEPLLVGISNEGPVASIGESHLISECGTAFGSTGGDSYNAISWDGSKVFFTALGRDAARECETLPAGAVEPASNEIFARIDNGQSDAHTVAISEPSGSDCGECATSSRADAQYHGASLDGARVFFTTSQQLLPGALGTGDNLYEYNFNGPAHERVTLVSSGDPAGARVLGVARVSEDGSHVYFVAQGVLTGEEENVYGVKPQEGAENLYVSERVCLNGDANCSKTHLSFIGRLSATDDLRAFQVTPDGRFLVFQSTADLTPDEEGREEAGQVFEYDARTGALVRVSQGDRGYNENGNSSLYPATIPIQSYAERDLPTERFSWLAMSDDGAYVFFSSENGLTASALLHHPNVYEYHDGRVALISDGRDLSIIEGRSGVELLGTDESGRDVFFATADPLLQQDTDTQQDIYDARIGGGPDPSVTPAPCSGDSCQAAASGSPSLLGQETSSVVGEVASAAPSANPPSTEKAKAKTKRKSGKHAGHKRKKRRAKKTGIAKRATRGGR
jgi:hypothetical protein